MKDKLLNKAEPKLGGLYFSCVISAVVLAAFAFSLLPVSGDTKKFLSYSLSSLAIVIVTIVFISVKKLDVKSTLAIKIPKPRFWGYAALVFFATFFGLSGINTYFIDFLSKCFGYNPVVTELPEFSVLNFVLATLTICVLPAVFEEAAFRGFMLSSLSGGNCVAASLLVGALFSMYHLNPAQTPYQLAVGFAYCLLAVKSGSTFPSAVLHFLNNFLILVFQYAFGGLNFSFTLNLILTVAGVIAYAIFVFVLVKFERTENTVSEKAAFKDFLLYAVFGIFICVAVWVSALL